MARVQRCRITDLETDPAKMAAVMNAASSCGLRGRHCLHLPASFGAGYEHFTSSKARFALWGRRGKNGLVSSRDGDLTRRKNMGM